MEQNILSPYRIRRTRLETCHCYAEGMGQWQAENMTRIQKMTFDCVGFVSEPSDCSLNMVEELRIEVTVEPDCYFKICQSTFMTKTSNSQHW